MNKNKGFTLIEVVIALAIITTVSFIGYQVINKTSILSKNQALTADIQNGVNNLKRYMMNELSSAKEVTLSYENDKGGNINDIEKRKIDYDYIDNRINNISKSDSFSYKYLIEKSNEDTIIYEISIYKKGNKKIYSIDRVDNKVKMNFIINQPLSDKLIPLKISLKDENLYDIELNYIKQNTLIYSFDVYNRVSNLEDKNESTDKGKSDTVIEHNYLSYCVQQINLAFEEAKNKSNPGFDKKLDEAILKEVNELLELSKENPPRDIIKVKKILNNLMINLNNFRRHPSNQLNLIFDELNKLEYYIEASNITVNYIEKPNYVLNKETIVEIHNYSQYKIVSELSKARDEVWGLVNKGYNLNSVWNKIHTEFLANDILRIQKKINWNIIDNFNPNEDISEYTQDISTEINDLIDKIIDQQVIIKDVMRGKFSSSSDGDLALQYLDNVKEYLIKVKYMLGETNYHKV